MLLRFEGNQDNHCPIQLYLSGGGEIPLWGEGVWEEGAPIITTRAGYFVFAMPERKINQPQELIAEANNILIAHAHYTIPPAPPPEPETPTEPETPEPETPTEPEPENPTEPESCPVEPRCDHIAIVPGMPRAVAGDEGTPDHWLRITNPGPEGITFTVTGRDDAGTKGGTYRRELPAYRTAKVKMRDIEAAFDVTNPAGWWRLVVTGSGPVEVVATMRQGDTRRFVPVRTPATCGAGPVTRTGG